MQKKIIIPLVMGASALPAFANVALSTDLANLEGWTATGITGDAFNTQNDQVNCGIGTGVVSKTVQGLPKGNYSLKFTSATNIKVTVDGTELTEKEGVYTFSLAETKDVTVEITGASSTEAFSFGKGSLTFVEDFSAKAKALQEALDAVSDKRTEWPTYDTDTWKADTKDLAEQNQAFLDKVDAIQKEITAVGAGDKDSDNAISVDDFVKWCTENGYDSETGFKAIEDEIAALDKEVETLNAAIQAASAREEVIEANAKAEQEALDALTGGDDSLQAQVKALVDALDAEDACAYTVARNKEAAEALQKAVEDAVAAVKTAYRDEDGNVKDEEVKDYESPVADLQKQYDALAAKVTADNADYAAYASMYTAYEALLQNYTTYYNKVAEVVKGVDDDHAATLNDWKNQYQKAVADLLAAATTYTDGDTSYDFQTEKKADAAEQTGIEGYAAIQEAWEQQLTDKGNEMKSASEKVKRLVDAANQSYKDAVATINGEEGYQAQYDALAAKTAPSNLADDYAALLKTAKDAIDALSAEIEKEYAAEGVHTVDQTTKAYKALVKTVEEALKAAETMTESATFADAAALQTSLDEIWDANKATELVTGTTVADKFQTTYDELAKAVKDLNADSSAADTKAVKDAIDNFKANVKKVVKIFTEVNTKIAEYQAKCDAYVEFVAGRDAMEAANFTKDDYTTEAAKFKTEADKFADDLAAAAKEDGSKLYDAATAVDNAFKEVDQTKVDEAKFYFCKAVSQANLDAYGKALDAVQKERKDAKEAPGIYDEATQSYIYKIKIYVDEKGEKSESWTAGGAVETKKQEKLDAETYTSGDEVNVTPFDEVDKTCLNAMDDLKAASAEIAALVASHEAYVALEDDMQAVEDAIAAVKTDNEKSAGDAQTYYGEQIDAIEKAYNETKEAIEKSHDEDFDVAEKQATYEGALNGYANDANALSNAITANNLAHNTQLSKSGSVRSSINGYIAEVNKGEDAAAVAEYVKELNDLLDKLDANDEAVNSAYGKGESEKQNEALLAEYERILKAAQDVYAKYTGDEYTNQVYDTNTAAVDAQGLNSALKALKQAYLNGIANYNQYRYSLKNVGYKAAIADVVGDHADLYEYESKYLAESEAIDAWVKEQSEKQKHVLTDEEIATKVAEVNALTDEINDNVAAMYEAVNTKAAEFYSDYKAENDAALQAAFDKLTEAGIMEAALDSALPADSKAAARRRAESAEDAATEETTNDDPVGFDAETYYLVPARQLAAEAAAAETDAQNAQTKKEAENATDEEKAATEYGVKMDGIADTLDKVQPEVTDAKLVSFAREQWSTLYTKAYAQMEAWAKALKELPNLYAETIDAAYGNYEASIKALDEAFAEVADEDMFSENGFPYYLAQLKRYTYGEDGYLPGAKEYYEEGVQASADRTVEVDACQAYLADRDELQARIDTLRAYVNKFAGSGNVDSDVDGAQDTLDKFSALFEDENGEWSNSLPDTSASDDGDREGYLKLQLRNVDSAIVNAYNRAVYQEGVTFGEWVTKTKAAFNDAYEANKTDKEVTDKLDADSKTLDELAGKVATYQATNIFSEDEEGNAVEDAEKAATFQTAIEADIKTLAELYVKYTQLKNSEANPVGDAVTAFKTDCDELLAAIDESKAAMDELVADEYADDYDALTTAVNDLEAAYEAEGALAVVDAQNYENALAKLKDALENLDAVVDAAGIAAQEAKAKKDASDAAYTDWMNQYNELKAEYEAMQQKFAGYGYNADDETSWGYSRVNFYSYYYQYWMAKFVNALEDANETTDVVANNSDIRDKFVKALSAKVDCDQQLTAQKAQEECTATNTKLNDAAVALAYDNIVDVAELRAQLADLRDRYAAQEEVVNKPLSDYTYYEESTADLEGAIAELEAIQKAADELVATATANKYTAGDVNNDGEVNVADAQTVINWVGENVDLETLKAQKGAVVAAAANVTADDVLNIADVTGVIKLSLGEAYAPQSARRMAPAASNNNTFELALIGNVNGATRYAVILNNADVLSAGQFDVRIAAGSEIVNVVAAERCMTHDALLFNNSDFSRILLVSLDNTEISGNAGAVVYIDVQGEDAPEVDAMVFSDRSARSYAVNNSGTSSLMDVFKDAVRGAKDAIYDAMGRMYNSVQRGLNIIRHEDGSVTKEIRK
jgi:hypothetical protein